MDVDDSGGACVDSLSSLSVSECLGLLCLQWSLRVCTCIYRIALVWFHCDLACSKCITDKCCQDILSKCLWAWWGRVWLREFRVQFKFLFRKPKLFIILKSTLNIYPPCISAKHRQNETLNLWLIQLGDSDNMCQAFLSVEVGFPGFVNISHEVRRIHSLSTQSWKALISQWDQRGVSKSPSALQRTLTHLGFWVDESPWQEQSRILQGFTQSLQGITMQDQYIMKFHTLKLWERGVIIVFSCACKCINLPLTVWIFFLLGERTWAWLIKLIICHKLIIWFQKGKKKGRTTIYMFDYSLRNISSFFFCLLF